MRLFSYLNHLRQQKKGERVLPRFLTYTVTFSCNARCIMCDSWKKPSPGDLSTDEVSAIFDQLPQMDAVRLTGGEPFVRKDMGEIAEMVQAKLKPMFLHITTNGFLTDRIVSFCEKRSKKVPLFLLLSMDGLKEKHNQVRGHGKAWDYAIKTLNALAPRRKELNIKLAVNQTIVDAEGAQQYRDLRAYLAPLGVRNNAIMAYDASATYSCEDEVDLAPSHSGEFHTFGDFSKAQLNQLLDEVDEDLKSYPITERLARAYYVKGVRQRLMAGHGDPNPACVSLGSHLRIFPDGRMPVCQFNTTSVGNLRHQSFAEIWESAKTDRWRDWVHKCPGCWAECEILPNAVYSGDLLAHRFKKPRPKTLVEECTNV